MSRTSVLRWARLLTIGALVATSAGFTAAWAQIGSSTDIVTGLVMREGNTPVEGAQVELKDSLALTEEQLGKLKPLSDSLAARNATLGAEMRKVVQDAGANPDMGAMFARIRPVLEKLQKQNGDAMREVEKILTNDQWAKVPERVKRGQMPGMGSQGRQEGRRPPQ